MIFVTVGTQLPFDRLTDAMADWAARNPGQKVIVQTGRAGAVLDGVETRPFVDADEFRSLVERADVLVAHAGMGSILTAVELGKKVIVMPRKAELGEHRNDHQRATAEKLSHLENLRVVDTAEQLSGALDAALKSSPLAAAADAVSAGRDRLMGEIRNFIFAPLPGGAMAEAA